jgi:glycosyltransferase involved in cell wall biosynthesis
MRALYLSHTGMTEPLGRSQVVPYVRGLRRAGWKMEIIAFEPAGTPDEECRRVAEELRDEGIGYHAARRSPSHAPAVKALEAVRAMASLVARSLAERPRIVHARSHLPGAVAYALAAAAPGTRFVFDCRGLLGDEYVDAGHWRREWLRYRVLKTVERRLFARASAVVSLTDRLRRWLYAQDWMPRATPVEVIPCCVDLSRFTLSSTARASSRQALGAGDRFVLGYSGTLGSWYCEEEMARLFATLRGIRPSLFAVFTRSSTERLRAALRTQGVPDEEVRIRAVAPEEMSGALAGVDGGVALIAPVFSKIASSPVKVAEYLALGAPVVLNRGIGDGDDLLDGGGPVVDAGALTPGELDRAAAALAALPGDESTRRSARELARMRFDLEEVGVRRYQSLYERLAG